MKTPLFILLGMLASALPCHAVNTTTATALAVPQVHVALPSSRAAAPVVPQVTPFVSTSNLTPAYPSTYTLPRTSEQHKVTATPSMYPSLSASTWRTTSSNLSHSLYSSEPVTAAAPANTYAGFGRSTIRRVPPPSGLSGNYTPDPSTEEGTIPPPPPYPDLKDEDRVGAIGDGYLCLLIMAVLYILLPKKRLHKNPI